MMLGTAVALDREQELAAPHAHWPGVLPGARDEHVSWLENEVVLPCTAMMSKPNGILLAPVRVREVSVVAPRKEH